MSLHRALTVVTALVLFVPLGRAADLDPYLPEDTESILNINVRQLLDSELFKKHLLDAAQEALRGNNQVQDILKDLGFDPFKDLDRVVVASPIGTEKDRGLVIVHGRFDAAKFKAKAEEVAKDHSDNLKIHKVKVRGGEQLLYEVNHPDYDDPVFVALAGRDTLLASPGKDYVVNALKKSGKEAKLKNEKFQALLEKVDAGQSLSLAAVTTPKVAKAIEKAPGDVKGMIEKIQAVAGGLTISDELKLEFAVTAKDAKDAKDLSDSAKAGLNLVLGVAAPIAQNANTPKWVELVVEAVKALRVTNKSETVFVKGRISSDLIEDTLKKKDK